jgi:hypothetical protein
MLLMRRLSPALVIVAMVLAGPQPGAAPEYEEWAQPVRLPGPINSVGTFGAVVSRDGLTLFCTRGSSATADILVSLRSSTDEEWGTPVNLGAPVNTAYAEMIPALSRDEHWLFFTSDRPGSQSWDLWASWRRHAKDPFGWEGPVNLGPHVNTIAQETTGSYWEGPEDGPPVLFFASNRLMISPETPNPGSLPVGHDIYASPLLEDGTFGPAVLDEQLSVRLGGVQDLEGRPMVRFDGREIIFVSDRAGSLGAQDLWVATREATDGPWGTPMNLAPVNTTSAELHPYLSPDGGTLYFSRRESGTPYLYMTTRTGPGRRVGQGR